MHFSRKTILVSSGITAVVMTALFAFGGSFFRPVIADNQRAITIHDGEKTVTVASTAGTVGEVLERAKVKLAERDMVEPAARTELVAPAYTVNVYRARPVTIVDGDTKLQVMSPYQSPRSIVMNANIELYPEDIADMDRVDDFVSGGGPGLRVDVDRAIPVMMVLYGKQALVRTQAQTIGELLKEKNITLGEKDKLSRSLETPITKNLVVDVWRDGVQTKTEEKAIPFEVEMIQDADKPVGYRDVKTPGVKGRKLVTYQVELKNGKEVARKAIQSVVVEQPKKQVEIVGTKLSGGSHQDWMSAAGISPRDYGYVDYIMTNESHWRPNASSPDGLYHGLGQTNLGALSSACPNWQADPVCQLNYFEGYANNRYGGWAGAYEFKTARGWW